MKVLFLNIVAEMTTADWIWLESAEPCLSFALPESEAQMRNRAENVIINSCFLFHKIQRKCHCEGFCSVLTSVIEKKYVNPDFLYSRFSES